MSGLSEEDRAALEAACLEGLVHTKYGYRYRPAFGADAVERILAARDEAHAKVRAELDALRARVEALLDDPETEIEVEGGQPNGLGVVEPSWYREWFHESRETHHRQKVTVYGPWVDGPSRGAAEVNILRAALTAPDVVTDWEVVTDEH